MLLAISHVALVVSNPRRTADFFKSLFDARIVERIDEEGHDEIFVKLGGTWFLLAQAEVKRPRTGDHIAFKVTKEVLFSSAQKLKAMNREYFLARSDTSLYFFDDDDHVFELDSTDIESELDGLIAPKAAPNA
ncbi:MAG: VOC family protein [Burkholderiaceae bacterium]|jgi:catechol 2,3-dioxygenase-like lactoylglutathione lyase family enzyme